MTGQPEPTDEAAADTGSFDPSIYASALWFGSGTPRRNKRRRLRDDEIEDIVLDRQRGDGW